MSTIKKGTDTENVKDQETVQDQEVITSKFKHGQTKVVSLAIVNLRTKAYEEKNGSDNRNAGKFGLVCQQSPENPTGVFALTNEQLQELAMSSAALNDWQPLATALARGGCSYELRYEFCKEGEPIPGREGEFYSNSTKNPELGGWWKVSRNSIILSDAAVDYIDKITLGTDVAVNREAAAANRLSATELRNKRIALMMEA